VTTWIETVRREFERRAANKSQIAEQRRKDVSALKHAVVQNIAAANAGLQAQGKPPIDVDLEKLGLEDLARLNNWLQLSFGKEDLRIGVPSALERVV
jgi:hypothetical protein